MDNRKLIAQTDIFDLSKKYCDSRPAYKKAAQTQIDNSPRLYFGRPVDLPEPSLAVPVHGSSANPDSVLSSDSWSFLTNNSWFWPVVGALGGYMLLGGGKDASTIRKLLGTIIGAIVGYYLPTLFSQPNGNDVVRGFAHNSRTPYSWINSMRLG